jgi:hypothetical protein
MKHRRILALAILSFLLLGGKNAAVASDLDDGISQPMEDSISADDELGQRDRNINFIKLKAKSDAAVSSKSGINGEGSAQGSTTGTGNMNSVVLGPGGSVRNIYIIDESRGNKTQVVDR